MNLKVRLVSMFVPLLVAHAAHAIEPESQYAFTFLKQVSDEIDLKAPTKEVDAEKMKRRATEVKARLAKVVEADRGDARYVKYAKWAAEFDVVATRWLAESDANEKSEKTKLKLGDELHELLADHRSALNIVKFAQPQFADSLNVKQLLTDWQEAQSLDVVAAARSTKFASLNDPDCKDATHWKQTLASIYEAKFELEVARRAAAIAREVGIIAAGDTTNESALDSGGKVAAYVEKTKKEFAPLFLTIGRPLPEQKLAPLVNAAKGFPDALTVSQKKAKYAAGKFVDASATATTKAAFSKAGFSVLKISQVESTWTVLKDKYDIAVSRVRDSSVLAKKKGESFCRYYPDFTVKVQRGDEYGAYGAPFASSSVGNDFIVVGCK